jgi:enoyl-[acyl-carrier protein] reductase I
MSRMLPVVKATPFAGKKGLIIGIVDDQSTARGCAKAFRAFGAELGTASRVLKARAV